MLEHDSNPKIVCDTLHCENEAPLNKVLSNTLPSKLDMRNFVSSKLLSSNLEMDTANYSSEEMSAVVTHHSHATLLFPHSAHISCLRLEIEKSASFKLRAFEVCVVESCRR